MFDWDVDFRIALGTVVGFLWTETDCFDGVVGNGFCDFGFWVLDFVYDGFDGEDGGGVVEWECWGY